MEIVFNIGIGLLGVLFFIAWNSRKFIQDGTFKPLTHFQQNWGRWLWAIIMLILMAVIVGFEPKVSGAIKTFTGLDIANERGAFFTTGLALAGLIKGVVKKNA